MPPLPPLVWAAHFFRSQHVLSLVNSNKSTLTHEFDHAAPAWARRTEEGRGDENNTTEGCCTTTVLAVRLYLAGGQRLPNPNSSHSPISSFVEPSRKLAKCCASLTRSRVISRLPTNLLPGTPPWPEATAAYSLSRAAMAGGSSDEGAQVLVRFITKLPAELRVPETPVVSVR